MGEALHLCKSLRRRCEVIRAILGNVNIVLDAYTSDAPVPFQHIRVDIFTQLRRLQDRIDDKSTEVDLTWRILLAFMNIEEGGGKAP